METKIRGYIEQYLGCDWVYPCSSMCSGNNGYYQVIANAKEIKAPSQNEWVKSIFLPIKGLLIILFFLWADHGTQSLMDIEGIV